MMVMPMRLVVTERNVTGLPAFWIATEAPTVAKHKRLPAPTAASMSVHAVSARPSIDGGAGVLTGATGQTCVCVVPPAN